MDEVAIIGVGCRFPGVNNLDEFWNVLKHDEDHMPGNKRNAESHAEWDYKVYSIIEDQTLEMNVQQRCVLNSTYMALENAGITKQQLNNSNTGVYIGMVNTDCNSNNAHCSRGLNEYKIASNQKQTVASMLSDVFNLHGPSITVDSGSFPSLMAIQQAHQAVRSRKCDIAISGGVTVLNDDGCTRGEGCGIIILKSLEKAQEDNDPLWGTISTSSDHDSQSKPSNTRPSLDEQVEMLDLFFKRHHIDVETIDYIEAQSTDMETYDAVEVTALMTFFQKIGKTRTIGSVETNTKQLESTVGLAGLIKILLMHKYQKVVPSPNFEQACEYVTLNKYTFMVPEKTTNWPENDKGYSRSYLNSFCHFCRFNCHVVVTTKIGEQKIFTEKDEEPKIVCLSALDSRSLQEMKSVLCHKGQCYSLQDVSITSLIRRNHYPCRIAVMGTHMSEIIQYLNIIDVEKHLSQNCLSKEKKLIFVFVGLGTSWKGMCQSLLKRFDVFLSVIKEVSKLLNKYICWDVYALLQEGFELDDPLVNPLMTFACEVGLFSLLESFGIKAHAIIGISLGEVAAAYASGIVSLEQAIYIVYHRTRLQSEVSGGKMFVVKNVNMTIVTNVMDKFKGRANVALFASPVSYTIACNTDIVQEVKACFVKESFYSKFKDLDVTHAYHSHHMSECSKKMLTCTGIHGKHPNTPIFSTVTGAEAKENEFRTPEYWAENILKPVSLHQAVISAHDPEKVNLFIEIGPKPVLGAFISDIFKANVDAFAFPTLKLNDECESLTKLMTVLYEFGINLEWRNFVNYDGKVVDIPQYQFNKVTK